jgi:hypothetical protein
MVVSESTHGLALVPLRGGKPLPERNYIPLWGNTSVLGRVQLLNCMYMACNCDLNAKRRVTVKSKCSDCQKINSWAVQNLSVEMLRFSSSGCRLQVRGKCAAVFANGKRLQGLDEWSSNDTIQPGMTLSLRELNGDGRLDFEVTLKKKTSTKNQSIRTPSSLRVCKPTLKRPHNPPLPVRPTSTGQQDSCHLLTSTSEFVIYFVELGQDLPRHRREILGDKATEKGCSIVSDFRLATHLIVSEQVQSLEQVADFFRIPEYELYNHLDKVSRSGVSLKNKRFDSHPFDIRTAEERTACQSKMDRSLNWKNIESANFVGNVVRVSKTNGRG